MSYKRLIPCIFIYGGKAVSWFDDRTVIAEDAVELAKCYSDNGADELIVFDLSDYADEHEEAIDLMKRMNRVIRIPMVAGGNVKRQEDIKKISLSRMPPSGSEKRSWRCLLMTLTHCSSTST